ncbi:MAG: protoporphyrinogen oxidase [Candidatus Acidiferrales bacterium]
MSEISPSAIVIGAGISGLTCAYRLRRAGVSVLLLESSPRPGGMIRSVHEDGFLFELGPQSCLVDAPLLALIEDLGLADTLLRANPRSPRYILHHGRLRAVPLGPVALLTTSLVSARTKLRLVREAFGRTRPPGEDESVATFVRRKFGEEVLERIVAPMVSGIYAGDAEHLSVSAAFPSLRRYEIERGSILRGALKSRPAKGEIRPRLCSFLDGMETLPAALAESLGDALCCDAQVQSIRYAPTETGMEMPSARFQLKIARRGAPEMLSADAVIVATPCDASAAILSTVSEQFVSAFRQVEYAPVAVVSTGYARASIGNALDGFGFLVPRSEGVRMLGTVWNSSLFPDRAPQGHVGFASFAGGATDPDICSWPEPEIATQITKELARILRISAPPAVIQVWKYARALPQYNLGHDRIVASLTKFTAAVPGLFLAGNYLAGPSVGACVAQATQTSEAVLTHFARKT